MTWGRSKLLLQWNHYCASWHKLSPLRTETTKPAENKVMGTERKHFASGSLGEMVRGTTPTSTFYYWNHKS